MVIKINPLSVYSITVFMSVLIYTLHLGLNNTAVVSEYYNTTECVGDWHLQTSLTLWTKWVILTMEMRCL